MPTTTTAEIESTRGDFGRGVYSLPELRAFVGFDGTPADAAQTRKWLAKVLNPVEHRPWAADYSFSDLVSLFVVRELLRRGVHPHTIREAEGFLRDLLRIDRPFVYEDIKTDGFNIFYRDEVIPTQIEQASGRKGQQVLRATISDLLTSVKYTDGTAAYWTPADGILVDPRVQFGDPVIAGTRVPTEAAAETADRYGIERAAHQLRVNVGAIRAAVAFEHKLAGVYR